jgi:hypothetical protein
MGRGAAYVCQPKSAPFDNPKVTHFGLSEEVVVKWVTFVLSFIGRAPARGADGPSPLGGLGLAERV